MTDALLHVLAKIFGSFGSLMAPVSALAVSVAYYRSSPTTQPALLRLLASAHGLAVAFVWALMWYWVQYPDPGRLTAFRYLLLLPVGLMIASFFIFQGPRRVHVLQGVNLGALAYIAVLGEFALGTIRLF